MIRTAGCLQTGALCLGTTVVSMRWGWSYPAEQRFAADRLQRRLLPVDPASGSGSCLVLWSFPHLGCRDVEYRQDCHAHDAHHS